MNRHDYPILQAVYATTPSNLGDMASCPLNYFRFLRDGREVRTMHLHVRLEHNKATDQPTIIGGGGLLKKNNRDALQAWFEASPQHVLWGIGLNDNDGETQRYKPSNLPKKPEQCGLRDKSAKTWVPCASCMHPLLDNFRNVAPVHDVVVYEGWEAIECDYPRLSCWGLRNMRQAIEFIASGETVVTASYHGAFWATLLGRQVAVIPELKAAKFYHLKWPVPLGEPDELPQLIRKAKAHYGALQEARERTEWFAGRVAEFLDMEVVRSEPAIA